MPVRVGEAIDPLVLSPVPWNCFFSALHLSRPLPSNLTLQQPMRSTLTRGNGTRAVVAGTALAPFDTVATEVTLACSGLQTFSCGVVVLQACAAHTNASACHRSQCAWCRDTDTTGTCGFCTAAFDTACWRRTGSRASCAAAPLVFAAASSSAIRTPLPALRLLVLLLCAGAVHARDDR